MPLLVAHGPMARWPFWPFLAIYAFCPFLRCRSSREIGFISSITFRHSRMLSWKSPGDSNFDPHLLVTQNLVSILWPLPACSPTEISQEVAANTPRQRIATRIFTDLSLNFSTQENFNNIQPLSNFAYLIFVTTGGCVTFFS